MIWDFQLANAAQRVLRWLHQPDRTRVNRALNEMKQDPLLDDAQQ